VKEDCPPQAFAPTHGHRQSDSENRNDGCEKELLTGGDVCGSTVGCCRCDAGLAAGSV
jgi:hypothetical protein